MSFHDSASGEELRYLVEERNERGSVVRVLAASSKIVIARAAFKAAMAEYPDRELTLRNKALIIMSSEHDRPDPASG